MRQTPEESADLQGEIGAAIIKTAFLFADESRLYVRSPLQKYAFSPEQVVTIEASGDLEISIKHTRWDYPAKITFTSAVSANEMIATIGNKGFIPTASVDGIPNRERFIFRTEAITPIWIAIVLSVFTGDFGIRWILVDLRMPIFATAIICAIRLLPSIQSIVFQPGRYIGEISPSLDGVILVLGGLGIGSILMALGIPELFATFLTFAMLWAIVEVITIIDLKFMP
jgi:hypothetical protein